MRRLIGLIAPLAVLLVILSGALACKSSSPSDLDVSAIRAYADPATETVLQGLSEGDLSKYTKNANSEFKAAVTWEIFDRTAAQIKDKLGAYVSMEFLRINEQGGYTIVHYRAKYEKGEIGIRMVFDREHLIAGQWFE